MRTHFQLALTASLIIAAAGAQADLITLTVGAGGFTTLHDAVLSETAGNTYQINIAAGTYPDDFSTVNQPTSITAIGGTAILQANIPPPDLKGIITTNTSLSVNNLAFQGAAISPGDGGNAAGIRDQSGGATTLHVENSQFIGNQNGILTGGSLGQETVEIINSFFLDNGGPNGPSHALYVGDALSLLVSGSTFCGTNVGHDIKSRALSTTVQNSTMYDGATGSAGMGCSSAGTASFRHRAAQRRDRQHHQRRPDPRPLDRQQRHAGLWRGESAPRQQQPVHRPEHELHEQWCRQLDRDPQLQRRTRHLPARQHHHLHWGYHSG
jgi:hypothetical protein